MIRHPRTYAERREAERAHNERRRDPSHSRSPRPYKRERRADIIANADGKRVK